MDRKFLEGLGIEKEVIDQVLDQNGAEVAALNARIKAKDTEISTLRTDLTDANTKVAEYSKEDIATLRQQLQDERDGRAADRRNWNLSSVLTQAGCTDIDYILYKLGDSVKFDKDGNVEDAENFAKDVKERYPKWFKQADEGDGENKPAGTGSAGNFGRDHNGKTPASKNPYTKEGWNLTEQMMLELNDPDKAKKLKIEAEA